MDEAVKKLKYNILLSSVVIDMFLTIDIIDSSAVDSLCYRCRFMRGVYKAIEGRRVRL